MSNCKMQIDEDMCHNGVKSASTVPAEETLISLLDHITTLLTIWNEQR